MSLSLLVLCLSSVHVNNIIILAFPRLRFLSLVGASHLFAIASQLFPFVLTIAALKMASGDYRVADISLADFGRKEIRLSEVEMPGLMVSAT